MHGPSGLELVIILLVILLIFGPKNLPKLGKMFGKTVKNVRDGMEGVDEEAPAAAPAATVVVTPPVEAATEAAPAEVETPIEAPAAEAPATDQPAQ